MQYYKPNNSVSMFQIAPFFYKHLIQDGTGFILGIKTSSSYFAIQEMVIYENGAQSNLTIQNGSCEVNNTFWGKPCEEGQG